MSVLEIVENVYMLYFFFFFKQKTAYEMSASLVGSEMCIETGLLGYLAGFKTEITTEHMDWIYHNVACRAAIKAGDHTSHP